MAQQPSEDEEDFGPLDKGVPQKYIGEDCPICSAELVKPRSELPQCPHCRHIENGRVVEDMLRDFNLSHRQGKRLLDLFGYNPHGTPGSVESKLRHLCHDHDISRDDLNDFLNDLRGDGRYSDESDEEDEDEDEDFTVNTDPFCVLCGKELEGGLELDTGVCGDCADD